MHNKSVIIYKILIVLFVITFSFSNTIIVFASNIESQNSITTKFEPKNSIELANLEKQEEVVKEEQKVEERENTELEEEIEEVDVREIQEEVLATSSKAEEMELNSRIALIYDRASGRIMYEKNGNKQTPMASTTKIMTAIVVLENTNLKDTVTITSKAAGTGGSRLGLKKNDKITVNDLLY